MIQLVQAHRRLAGRRTAGHKRTHLFLDIVERRAIFPARPDVGKPLGELRQCAGNAGSIAAGDDDRALLAKRFFDDLDEPFAGLKIGSHPFPGFHQLIDYGMRCPDHHQVRLGVGCRHDRRRLRDGNLDASRLEAKPRRQVDHAVDAVAVSGQQDVNAIRDQIVVGVAERALVRIKRREIEILLRTSAGSSRGRWCDGRRRCRGHARQIDGRVCARRADPNAKITDRGIRERALRIASADDFELVERNLGLHDVAGRGHLRVDENAIRALDVVLDVDRRYGDGRRRHVMSIEILLYVGGDLLDRRPFLFPHER